MGRGNTMIRTTLIEAAQVLVRGTIGKKRRKSVSAKLYSVPKKDSLNRKCDLIVLYSKLFFYLITPRHEPVNLLWMLNDINLRHYLQYVIIMA